MKHILQLLMVLVLLNCSKSDNAPMVCKSGFEGATCENAFNGKFVGNYNSSETCDTGPASYSTVITANLENPLKMIISGLWEEPASFANATILEEDSSKFAIPRQEFSNGDWDIEASGAINNDTISLSYTIYNRADNVIIDRCTHVMTPK